MWKSRLFLNRTRVIENEKLARGYFKIYNAVLCHWAWKIYFRSRVFSYNPDLNLDYQTDIDAALRVKSKVIVDSAFVLNEHYLNSLA